MLTDRQQEVVDFIRLWWKWNRFGPSYADIAEELTISKTGAVHHVERLVELGVLERTPGVARSIRPKVNLRRLGKRA